MLRYFYFSLMPFCLIPRKYFPKAGEEWVFHDDVDIPWEEDKTIRYIHEVKNGFVRYQYFHRNAFHSQSLRDFLCFYVRNNKES